VRLINKFVYESGGEAIVMMSVSGDYVPVEWR